MYDVQLSHSKSYQQTQQLPDLAIELGVTTFFAIAGKAQQDNEVSLRMGENNIPMEVPIYDLECIF